jgi:hypothetical protein
MWPDWSPKEIVMLRTLAMPAIGIALMGLASGAHAASVSYNTTSSSFIAAGTDTSPGGPYTLEATSGVSTLDLVFTPVPGPAGSGLNKIVPGAVALGQLILTSGVDAPDSPAAFNNGDQFNLVISVTAPGAGGATTYGTFNGNVTVSGGLDVFGNAIANQSDVKISFAPNPVEISGVGFDYLFSIVQPVDLSYNTNQPSGALATITADVTVAPLPATASMGLGLFGVIGAAGVLSSLRRRQLA